MKAYIEITVLPDADVDLYFLWGKLFQQLHLALADQATSDGNVSVGISFPEYAEEKHFLGKKLRLFAQEEALLERLNIRQWLQRLSDYIHLTSIRPVPANVRAYARFRRVQPQSSLPRIARRKAKREGISLEQAMKNLNGFQEQVSRLPFITLQSLSSQQLFRLFIAKETVEENVVNGFSTYGLSAESTVPEF